jgi:hypothetical protein
MATQNKNRVGTKAFILTALILSCSSVFSLSIGDIAETISSGAGMMTKLMWGACIVVGIVLLAAAVSQYQIHRANPKIAPLGVPVTYLILALLALSIPFLHYITGIKKPDVVTQQQEQIQQQDDLDYNTDNDYED